MRTFARNLFVAALLCVPIACPRFADAAVATPPPLAAEASARGEWRVSPVFAKMHREVPECPTTSER